MKLKFDKLPSIKKVNLDKFKSTKLFSFFQKLKDMIVKLDIGRVFKSKAFKIFFLSLIVILAISQIVFGVMIYKYKATDKVTRFAAKVLPFPAAVVNYEAITYNEYLGEQDYIHQFYKSTNQEEIDINEIDKQVLKQLVENKVIKSEARNNKISVSAEEVDKAFGEIVEQNGGKDSVEKVLKDLYGIDSKKFKLLIKSQLLRDKVSDQLIAKVTARHILVRVDSDAPEADVNKAKEKIQGFLDQIKGGADFAEVAKQNSEDVGSAEQGGLLDPFAKGEMVESFSETAFTTPVGQLSEPVRTEFGWHIIKVEGKSGKIEKTFADWLTDLKQQSFIINLV